MPEQTSEHVHTWGEWTPRDGAKMPWWRGCTSCPATERQAAEQDHHLQRVFELIGSVPVNGEHPDDFELSPADWERLKTCICAHCAPGDDICPMTVQAMIGDYITERDDDLAAALAPYILPGPDAAETCRALGCEPGWPDRDCPIHGWSK